MMIDPVSTADGHSYEKSAILEWIQTGHMNSPLTGERLKHDVLTPNHNLRSLIQNFKKSIPAIQRERTIKLDLDMAIKLREEFIQEKIFLLLRAVFIA